MKNKFKKSNQYLNRSLKTIPLASQTFSKSLTQYPFGITPYFFSKARGSKIWDIDGNRYIDFVNSLLSISIGYRNKDIDDAVLKQMKNGVIFSMPHKLETELAELICKIIPCAESVRFSKNGSDATAGAIRLSRAYTNREHIAVCGYHGWQDWYIASTSRNLGVTKSDIKLTHSFKYNDINSLAKIFKKYKNKIAAVILEPMNIDYPRNNFLEKVKKLTHKNKSILIFDEICTGFRWSLGGAQEYFNVTPDLATFGKGIANGYPLSVLTGKKKIMKLMENIFYSTTFGGETLSLAAAKAVITKMMKEPVIKQINLRGKYLKENLQNIIIQNQLENTIEIKGHYPWLILNVKDTEKYSQWVIKTYILQEMISKGIFFGGAHNISYSHSEKDIKLLISTYAYVLNNLNILIKKNNLKNEIKTEILKPLFKVR